MRAGHWRLLLDNEDLFGPRLHKVEAMPDMISRVARNPAAIGYETQWVTAYYRQKGNAKAFD